MNWLMGTSFYSKLSILLLRLLTTCSAEFTELLPEDLTYIEDKISVSLFFFGVYSTKVGYRVGSSVLLNCEYAVDLSTEVQYISIVKEGAISYQYSCGATEHGPKLSNLSFANYSARLINSSLSLVLSYDGISNTNGGNNCKSIPRHKGSVLLELNKFQAEDAGLFTCQVHIRRGNESAHRSSQSIQSALCDTESKIKCADYDAEEVKKCPEECRDGCRLFGVSWLCRCDIGYELTDNRKHCVPLTGVGSNDYNKGYRREGADQGNGEG